MIDVLSQRVQELRDEVAHMEREQARSCYAEPCVDAPKHVAIYEVWGLLDDALRQAQREMGIDPAEEELAPAPSGLCPMLGDLGHRLHVELDRARQVLAAIHEAKAHLDGGATGR